MTAVRKVGISETGAHYGAPIPTRHAGRHHAGRDHRSAGGVWRDTGQLAKVSTAFLEAVLDQLEIELRNRLDLVSWDPMELFPRRPRPSGSPHNDVHLGGASPLSKIANAS